MKLNINATVIDTPADTNNFVCTFLELAYNWGKMRVNCVSDEWDIKPLDKIDRERCAWYGSWVADFYLLDATEPSLTIALGDTQLETPDGADQLYGFEVYGIEGVNETLAVISVVNAALWALLSSSRDPHEAHVVNGNHLLWAEWILDTGLKVFVKDNNDVKIQVFIKDHVIERLYRYNSHSNLVLKQTLITTQHLSIYERSTKLIPAKDHLWIGSKEKPNY